IAFEMKRVEPAVDSILRDELVVCARFGEAPSMEYEDAIGISDGRKAVRDDDGGAPLRRVMHRALQLGLGLAIDIGRRFVENQEGAIVIDGAGKGEELPLTCAKVLATFTHDAVETPA